MFAPPAEVLPQSVLAEAGYPSVRVDEEETRSREVGVRVCRRRRVVTRVWEVLHGRARPGQIDESGLKKEKSSLTYCTGDDAGPVCQ